MPQPVALITTAEAAVILGVTTRHVTRMVGTELEPVLITALGFIFDRGDVERLAEQRQQASA